MLKIIKIIKRMLSSFEKGRNARDILKKKGVVSLTEGEKNKEGEPCVKVFVEKKKPESKLKREDIVPRKLGLIKTDVEEMPMPKAQLDRKKYKPLVGGCEIAPVGKPWVGTAGNYYYSTLVYSKGNFVERVASFLLPDRLKKHFGITTEKAVYVGTNMHVVTSSMFSNPIGTKIMQPGGSGRHIGEVVGYVPVEKGEHNEFDEALIEITDDEIGDGRILNIGSIIGTKKPKKGLRVQKRGRTTNYTSGEIVATGVYVNIDFGKDGIITFKDMVQIKGDNGPFSDRGDSGSAICDFNGNFVARLNSGNGVYTWGIPANKILKKLKLRVKNKNESSDEVSLI